MKIEETLYFLYAQQNKIKQPEKQLLNNHYFVLLLLSDLGL